MLPPRLTAFSFMLMLAAGVSASTPTARAMPAGYTAAALYNLGNAYARNGKPGLAVLNYRRASLLAPNDADVRANLQRVLESVHLPSDRVGWVRTVGSLVPPLAAAWIGAGGLVIMGADLFAGWITFRGRWLRRAGLLVGVAMLGFAALSAASLWPRMHEAVVLAPAAPVRVSPVPMGDTLFSLAEAETVKITARHEGFFLVQTRTGRRGWMSSASVAPVAPIDDRP